MGSRTIVHLAVNGVSTGQVQVIDTRTLADAQGEALGRLSGQFASIVATGCVVTVQGASRAYQIDDTSLIRVGGKGADALASLTQGGWDPDFYWIAMDNSHQPMAAQDCIDFARTISAYDTALVYANSQAKAAIAALSTVAACDAFDVTAGWPSNP